MDWCFWTPRRRATTCSTRRWADIAAGERHTTRYWVERTAERAATIHEEALSRLVDHGILEREDDRMLWVFRTRRYPLVDGQATAR